MSTLVEHAKRELARLGNDENFNQTIVNAVAAFAQYGHSGGSAPYATAILNDLLQFKALSPLTDDPAEWNEVGEGVWQNSRNSEAFSTDGGKTYYLVSEMTPYYYSDEHQVIETSGAGEAGAVLAGPGPTIVNGGDTVVPVTVTSDQPQPGQ